MTDNLDFIAAEIGAMLTMTDAFWAAIPENQRRVQVARDFSRRVVECVLSADVATKKIIKVKWPANWVESIKERWLPGFIKRKWPVKYAYCNVDALLPLTAGTDTTYGVPVRYMVRNSQDE